MNAKSYPVTVTSIHWVSCDDCLPDDEMTVLLFSPGADQDVFIGWRDSGQWFDCYEGGIAVRARVSHWAPLPSGPDPKRRVTMLSDVLCKEAKR